VKTQVVRFEHVRGALLAGALWSACALASAWLRDTAGATLLVWMPSAVAVASLYTAPPRRWPLQLAALAAAQLATSAFLGLSLFTAVGFMAANVVEALICASLGIRTLGGRAKTPQSFGHIAGLFAAAVLGCALGALIATPFRAEPGLAEFAWWFLSSVLGVLTGTPVLLYLRQRFGFGNQTLRFHPGEGGGFAVTATTLLALGTAVLASPASSLLPVLMPVLFVAIVFAVIVYGQLAAAFGVLAYGVAATLASLGGGSPAAFPDLSPAAAGLSLQALMLLMLASALPIAAMLLTRERLAAQLREQNAELHENLTILNLVKTLAGIGRWRYDLVTGRQDWSEQMLVLNGLSPDLAPDPGDIRHLLPDRGKSLFGKFTEHRDTRIPYSFDYTIYPPGQGERTLKLNVFNEFDAAGRRVAVFAVAMDVTEQVQRERALRQARERAIGLAAEAQKLAMTDPLTGLANRRATFDWLQQLIPASLQSDEPLTVMLFDIDHFKHINDSYGHQTGDEVLKQIAAIARREVRAEDLVGRIGGEEFVCLLSGLDEQAAGRLAERLRGAIAAGGGQGLPRATISLGLAKCRDGDTPETLLARADAALYEAKEAGRNQVRRAA